MASGGAARRPWHEMRPANASTRVADEFRARGAGAAWALLKAKMAFKARQLKTVDKMTRLIDTGVDNNQAVQALYDQATSNGRRPDTALGYVFGDWQRRAAEGQTMSEFTSGWLPDDARPLIAAGEESSSIPRALQQYIFVAEKKKQMLSTVKDSLKVPLMNMVLIVVYLWVIAYKMTPVFAEAVPRSAWTGSLYLVGGLGDLIKDDLAYMMFGLVAVVGLIMWSMDHVLGKTRIRLDKFPPWSIYRQMYGANFMLSFAALYGAGIKDSDIMQILLRGSNRYYSERLRAYLVYINQGVQIGDTLLATGFGFPDPELVADMQIYQTLPDLPTVMEKVSRQFVEDSIKRVKAGTNVIAGLLTALGFIVVALMTQSNFEFVNLVQKFANK